MACQTGIQKRSLLLKRHDLAKKQLNFFLLFAQLRLKEISPLADIHGTIQHPCWIMSPINKLTGDGIDDVSVERCRTGVQAIDGDCKWGPVRKPTLLKATSTWITQKLSVECQCLVPPHVQMTSLPTAPGHAELKPSFPKLAVAAIQQARREAAHHGGRTSCPAWPARCAGPQSKPHSQSWSQGCTHTCQVSSTDVASWARSPTRSSSIHQARHPDIAGS